MARSTFSGADAAEGSIIIQELEITVANDEDVNNDNDDLSGEHVGAEQELRRVLQDVLSSYGPVYPLNNDFDGCRGKGGEAYEMKDLSKLHSGTEHECNLEHAQGHDQDFEDEEEYDYGDNDDDDDDDDYDYDYDYDCDYGYDQEYDYSPKFDLNYYLTMDHGSEFKRCDCYHKEHDMCMPRVVPAPTVFCRSCARRTGRMCRRCRRCLQSCCIHRKVVAPLPRDHPERLKVRGQIGARWKSTASGEE
ncbi:hypothetical protein BGZ54_007527 [Gamsiella multidivaricata]|nr:hypothetical protein BGZ54_007527 [Gamsiella multidivaricata]